jgi:hypothetical protein
MMQFSFGLTSLLEGIDFLCVKFSKNAIYNFFKKITFCHNIPFA